MRGRSRRDIDVELPDVLVHCVTTAHPPHATNRIVAAAFIDRPTEPALTPESTKSNLPQPCLQPAPNARNQCKTAN